MKKWDNLIIFFLVELLSGAWKNADIVTNVFNITPRQYLCCDDSELIIKTAEATKARTCYTFLSFAG